MPDITASTPREQYTIAGKTFNVFQPYAEGHVLTSNEAASMNQTFAENVRNNFAKRVKEASDAGTFDQDMFQSQLDDYMDSYEFGQRTGGGGRVSDPVEAEALRIAKDKVRQSLAKQGKKVADYTTAAITQAAKDVLAKYPQIRETARAIVAAASDIDIGDAEVEAPAPANETEGDAPAKGKKSA